MHPGYVNAFGSGWQVDIRTDFCNFAIFKQDRTTIKYAITDGVACAAG